MPTVIKGTLSVSSIKNMQDQLKAYKERLIEKCSLFTERLAAAGILVGQRNLGEFDKYVVFTMETDLQRYGAKTVLYATNSGIIHSQWMTKDGVKEADVSPILMAEFGSGLRANNPRAGEFGMGTGTFPGQTHAEDPEGWWYQTVDGEWHHSKGVAPTMPMYKAQMEIYDQIATIAAEVFRS